MSKPVPTPDELRICILADAARASCLKTRVKTEGFSRLQMIEDRTGLFASLREHQVQMEKDGLLQAVIGEAGSPFDLVFLTEALDKADIESLVQSLSGGELGCYGVVVVVDDENPEVRRHYTELGALDVFSFEGIWNEVRARLLLAGALVDERRRRHQTVDRYQAEISQRKVLETRLKYQVLHDELTGLANYRNLENRLENSTLHARQFARSNGLIYIDLGQFKLVNDIEGHEAGNKLLIQVAGKLRNALDNKALLARIGADEFVVLIENTSQEQIHEMALMLRERINEIIYVGNENTYHASASFGVVLQTEASADTPQGFFADAKRACRLAKQRGRNSIYHFNPSDDGVKVLEQDLKWMQRIRDALAQDRFFLVFQPVMELGGDRVTHCEALLRMRGGDGEMISPAQFIPVAERTGLIHQIDLWVVENVLNTIGQLHSSYDHVSFGLNLSSHAFEEPELLPLIERKLEEHWIEPGRIVFEITETAAITSVSDTRKILAKLRGMGCRFALDDFGSGFASFSYLKNFPVDVLKIDGSFVVNLLSDPMDQLLVKSMVDVAHSLDKKVIAEFVETQEVVDMLKGYGVDYAQGYFIGKPDPDHSSLLRAGIQKQNGVPETA